MLRGLIFGFLWGAVAVAIGLATLSLVGPAPGPSGEAPRSVDVTVPAGSEFNRNRPEAPPVIPGTEANDGRAGAPLVAGAEAENAPVTDTASASVPQSDSEAPAVPTEPVTEAGGLVFTLDGDADSGAGATSPPAISAPAGNAEAVPATPEPPAPETVTDDGTASQEPAQPAGGQEAETPLIIIPGDGGTTGETQEPSAAAADPAAEAPAEATPADDPVEEDGQAPQDNGLILTLPGEDDSAALTDTGEATGARTAMLAPATGEGEQPQVRRLPTIGTEESAATDAEADIGALEIVAAEDPDDSGPRLGALARNARPFVAPDDRPLMALVLLDIGEAGLGVEGLTSFSFPVTIAVDATAPDAAQRAALYRAAGLEVVVQAPPLPQGMTPADIGDHIRGLVAGVPQAIGLVDAAQGGFQSNRRMIDNAVAALAEGGHGLLTYDRGLNAALQVARSESLPAGAIYRTLDAEREDPETINRYLDRAAFRAGQEGQVIMIGHSYAETVTAVYTWMADARSQSVILAPLSAILRK